MCLAEKWRNAKYLKVNYQKKIQKSESEFGWVFHFFFKNGAPKKTNPNNRRRRRTRAAVTQQQLTIHRRKWNNEIEVESPHWQTALAKVHINRRWRMRWADLGGGPFFSSARSSRLETFPLDPSASISSCSHAKIAINSGNGLFWLISIQRWFFNFSFIDPAETHRLFAGQEIWIFKWNIFRWNQDTGIYY